MRTIMTLTAAALGLLTSTQQAMAAPETRDPALYAAQLDAWHTEMDEQCAAGARSVRIEHFDVDGNGTPDTICWRILKSEAFGEHIDVQARVKRKGKTQRAYLILPFHAGRQFGICGPSEAVVIEQGQWTKEDFNGMGWDYLGPVSISINGTDCDPPWLFWPKDAKGDVVDFIFARV